MRPTLRRCTRRSASAERPRASTPVATLTALGLAGLGLAGLALAGCGSASRPPAGIPRQLLAEARPIGVGPRFQPPPRGPVVGRCRRDLGQRRGVHIELFAANRVVIIPAGIGARALRMRSDGRIVRAACYGSLVTLDPTGIVLLRPGRPLSVADLFRAWGEPLSRTRLADFRAAPGGRVSVYTDGRRWTGAPGLVPLRAHAEIVLEVGPHVPPHTRFTFPPGS
jgi:hypothetical protein